MSSISVFGLLSSGAIIAYLLSLSTASAFLPQIIAILSILIIYFRFRRWPIIYLVSSLICLMVFCTSGLHSPLLFLIYFLLFIIAFFFPPITSLAFSLVLIILLSQSLNSPLSLIPLFSFLFITPLVWFVSRQTQSHTTTVNTIALEETDFLLWLNLKFKTGIITIIDLTSQLLSSPITPTQKDHLKKIKSSANNLLHSADHLTSEINSDSDE